MSSSSLLFVFGRTPDLSFAELTALFPNAERIIREVAKVDLPEDINPALLTNLLGGTVKIAGYLDTIESLDPQLVVPFLISEAKPLTFGLSLYTQNQKLPRNLSRDIKGLLAEKGISSRYVTDEEGVLSSVTVSKHSVFELILVQTPHGFMVGKTIAVQPFEEWNKRDYGRPFVDPKAGMLPPKVARMAVNLAVVSSQMTVDSKTLLDPFCGMGTILAEALLSGWNIIGSDQSVESVDKAQKNIDWLKKVYPEVSPSANFFTGDATHVSDRLEPESIDAIVTEPFMGPAGGMGKNIKNIIKGLEKLYIGSLRDWYKVLKPDGRVVMAFPKYVLNKHEYFVKKVIDSCENLGYTIVAGPLEYSRPQAVVRREFYVLIKKGK